MTLSFETITNVQAAFEDIRNNSDDEFSNLYSKVTSIAKRVDKAPLVKPRTAGQQRNNVSDTPEDYRRPLVFSLVIDCVKNSSAIDFKVKLYQFSNHA